MKKTITFSIIAFCLGNSLAGAQKTQDFYIPTDLPPPPSAEKIVPKHPFFSEPTTGNEVYESVEEQQRHIQKLEDRVARLEAEVEALKQGPSSRNLD